MAIPENANGIPATLALTLSDFLVFLYSSNVIDIEAWRAGVE